MIQQQLLYKYICSPDEVYKITGYKRLRSQQNWLDQHGWTYAVSGKGEVVLARKEMEAQLNPPRSTINKGQDQPDWSMFL